MDTLFVILIVAMATNFTAEFIDLLIGILPFDTRGITAWTTIPLSVMYHYFLSTEYPAVVACVAASSFLSLFLGIITDRVTNNVTEIRRNRR